MRNLIALALVALSLQAGAQEIKTLSPDGQMMLRVNLDANGMLSYSVNYKNKPAILNSTLGMNFKEPDVKLQQFDLVKLDSSVHDETWKPVWGEYSEIRDHHKQLRLSLSAKEGSGILVDIVFRVFNEGIAFRYEFMDQP